MSRQPPSATEEINPIKTDGELQMLVKKLDKVKKYKTFQRWKDQFLSRLDDFLYEKGMEPAEKSCNELDTKLKKLITKTTKVLDFIHSGDLGEDKKTVKASLALNEMCNTLEDTRVQIEDLIPSLKADERKKGFSKFHLGAALIRQGFHQYISMKAVEDAVTELDEKLQNVADRQQLDLFTYYHKQVQRFCDIMADLNLYAIMLKCVEFSTPPDEEESDDPEYLHIVVLTSDGRKLPMEVDTRDTVLSIKEAIQSGLDIPVAKQILQYQGKPIDDDSQDMQKLGVKDNDVLTVERLTIPITVKAPGGKTINMMVDPTNYISDLKRLLEPESGIPAKNQYLSLSGEELSDPNKVLEDCGIVAGTVLDLEPKLIKLNIQMPDNSTFQIDISPREETPAIKNKIEEATGMEIPRQVLKHDGEVLPDQGVSLTDMGMTDGSTVNVDIFKVPITVNAPGGNKIELMVDPTIYVSDLKRQLERESGIPAKNQNLSNGGVELDDPNKKLQACGIEAGTVLDLEPKVITVHVEMPDGKTFDIQVSPNEQTPALKDQIAAKSGMEVPRQVLKHDGEELPTDGVSSKDMGLQDGSTIQVEVLKVPITVNTPEGKSIELMVDPTEYLSDLKRQLEPESGISAKNQNLTKGGEELDDPNKKLQDYGIEAGTVLDLEPKVITLHVEMPDGNKFDIQVSPKDQTPGLKDQIAAKSGMAVPRQVLKHNGEELPTDGVSTKDMGLKDGSTIQVEVFKVPITVNAPDGKTIELMVEPTASLADLKRQLEPESGISANNQNLTNGGVALDDPNKNLEDYGIEAGTVLDLEPKIITIKAEMPDGKLVDIEISPKDETPTIKEKIAAKTGMAVPRQVLKHDGVELPENGVPSKDMGLKDGSTIQVEVFKVPITVNAPDGKTIELMVDPTAPLADLKRQLESESGIPVKNQNLTKEGEELDNENKKLEDYDIKAGTVLDLEPKIITIKAEMPDGKVVDIEISPKDETPTIKEKIAAKTGMAVPRQVLKHDGAELPENGVPSKDMGLKDGSTIQVEVFKVPITVNAPDGKTIELLVEPTSSLADLKRQLESESGIPVKNQNLTKEGEELDNENKKLEDYDIKAGTVLDLEPKIITIKAEMPDGKVVDIEISPKDETPTIKEKIAAKTGMAVPRQVLKHDGVELPENGVPSKDMGLKDGSTIQVEVFKVPITVNAPDGKTIELLVEPTSSLADLKRQLESESGIPVKNQNLTKDGEELDNENQKLQDYNIAAGTVLDLEPKVITINARMPDGKVVEIEVSPKDETPVLKEKIAAKSGMAIPRQVLKHDGQELPKDGVSTKDMGLKDGSTIDVEVFKLPVTVNTWDGKAINIDVEPTDPLKNIKKLLEAESGLEPSNQLLSLAGELLEGDNASAADLGIKAGTVLDLEPREIMLKVATPDGKVHDVSVTLKDTTDDIKKKIEDRTGIKVPRQVVKHNGEELPKDSNAKDLGLKEGSELSVDIFKLPIKVRNWDGNVISLDVEPGDTLGAIKKMLEPESGIPSSNQLLSRGGEELQGDNKTATEHGLKAGSVLDLEPRVIKVSVDMPDGKTKVVEISPSDDGDAIKAKIEAQTGLQVPRQVLSHDGNKVPDKGTTAKDLGLKDGSTLKAEIHKIPVTVNCWDGTKIKAMVEPTEKLANIKLQLEPESGIPASNQCLSKLGNELVGENKTANDLGITAGSTLDLEPKTINVTVTMPDGKKCQISVAPSDNSEIIKKKIETETGMEPSRQVLDFNGKPIPKDSTARELGLRDGSNINVGIFKVGVIVNTWDKKSIKIMVDPTDKLIEIKNLLVPESGIPASNQVLSMNDAELYDNNKRANAYGIQGGTFLYLEPRYIAVTVVMPDGSNCSFEVTAASTGDDIKDQVAQKTSVAASRQVLKYNGKEILADYTVRGMGIKDGSTIHCTLFKIPITVHTKDGSVIPLQVEPIETIGGIKDMLQGPSGLAPSKQVLTFAEMELTNNKTTATEYGIKKDSVLHLEPKDDPIVFLDVKYGILFGVDRDEVVEKGILTPNQGNTLEFQEAEKGSFGKDKMLKAMLDSPNLGIKPQIVVEKIEVEDYDVQEAEEVKSKWGVQLKKTQKAKRGDEFIFVDVKTGAAGLLDRNKMMEKKFITVVGHGKDETLKEGEKTTRIYDKYVSLVRAIFGIKATT